MVSQVSGASRSFFGRVQDTLGLGSANRRARRGSMDRKTGKAENWSNGTKHRVEGKAKNISGAITGNTSKQTRGNTEAHLGHGKQKLFK